MSKFIKLIDGLPVTVAPYDESTAYPTGLTALVDVTLPNSGSFEDANAKDILVILNDKVVEESRDFNVLGSSPYTQIEFLYDLPDDAIVRFRQNI